MIHDCLQTYKSDGKFAWVALNAKSTTITPVQPATTTITNYSWMQQSSFNVTIALYSLASEQIQKQSWNKHKHNLIFSMSITRALACDSTTSVCTLAYTDTSDVSLPIHIYNQDSLLFTRTLAHPNKNTNVNASVLFSSVLL